MTKTGKKVLLNSVYGIMHATLATLFIDTHQGILGHMGIQSGEFCQGTFKILSVIWRQIFVLYFRLKEERALETLITS